MQELPKTRPKKAASNIDNFAERLGEMAKRARARLNGTLPPATPDEARAADLNDHLISFCSSIRLPSKLTTARRHFHTLAEFASHLGVTPRAVQRWVAGERAPDDDVAWVLNDAFIMTTVLGILTDFLEEHPTARGLVPPEQLAELRALLSQIAAAPARWTDDLDMALCHAAVEFDLDLKYVPEEFRRQETPGIWKINLPHRYRYHGGMWLPLDRWGREPQWFQDLECARERASATGSDADLWELDQQLAK